MRLDRLNRLPEALEAHDAEVKDQLGDRPLPDVPQSTKPLKRLRRAHFRLVQIVVKQDFGFQLRDPHVLEIPPIANRELPLLRALARAKGLPTAVEVRELPEAFRAHH